MMKENIKSIQLDLKRYALYLTGNKYLVDDLVQDTNLKLLEKSMHYQEDKNFKSWAFTIMHNIFVDRKRKELKLPLSFNGNCDMNYNDPQDEKNKIKRIVKQAVKKLPKENERRIMLMRMYSFGEEEIANFLGVNYNAIRIQIHRIRPTLKQLINDLL